jgi:hypothetical protein
MTHIGYDDLRADTVRQVAKLMAAAAITAPKSGGQLFLAGKHNFVETVIVDDVDTRHELAEWMRARGTSDASRARSICRGLVRASRTHTPGRASSPAPRPTEGTMIVNRTPKTDRAADEPRRCVPPTNDQ